MLGGTATYAALTARNMGARVGVHTSASYEPGLIDTLRGVLVARVPAEFTTCFVNEYHEGKRRQTIESLADKLTYEQILPEWRNPAIVHLGPLNQELDAGSFITRFPRSLIGVTPQGWMRAWDENGLVRASEWADADKVLPKADVVVISEDDVADPSVIEDWASRAKMLVVTLGDRGCDVYRAGEPVYHSAAFKSGVEVDPTERWRLANRRRLGQLRCLVRGRKARRRWRAQVGRGRKALAQWHPNRRSRTRVLGFGSGWRTFATEMGDDEAPGRVATSLHGVDRRGQVVHDAPVFDGHTARAACMQTTQPPQASYGRRVPLDRCLRVSSPWPIRREGWARRPRP